MIQERQNEERERKANSVATVEKKTMLEALHKLIRRASGCNHDDRTE